MLPAELIDHIFSFLQKDTLALERCSKAHPLFSRLAERHLYAHIVVNQRPQVCNHILDNPHLLDHPRTLEIHVCSHQLSIMSIIPRMTNLFTLKIYGPCPFLLRVEFFSTLRNCLPQSSLQELYFFHLANLQLSLLDDSKSIKLLSLSSCTSREKEPVSSLPSSQLSLETLVLSNYYDPYAHRWAMRWVTRLTTLELGVLSLILDLSMFPELLEACSNSLSKLTLHMGNYYFTDEFPFTLSALMRLKRLSISAQLLSTAIESNWALPEIVRIVNTAPALHDVDLRFRCYFSQSIWALARLNWSLLNQLQTNSTGKCPSINLNVTYQGTTNPVILDALWANEALMGLVKRGLVILRSEHSESNSEGPFY